MRNKNTYQLLVAKMQEVAVVPPQTVGPFTFLYKKLASVFKFSPWRSAAFISFFTTILLYFLLGGTLVKLASMLQFGF